MPSISSLLEAPDSEPQVVASEKFPSFAATPMFSLSRLQSGVGVIEVSLEGALRHDLEVFVEEEDGEQAMIARDFHWAHGILLTKDGGVSIDLHRASKLRRLEIFADGDIDGTLVVSSEDLGWRRNFPIKSSNGGSTGLLLAFFCEGVVVLRNDGERHPSRRALAQARAFNSIAWRDDATPLH